MTLPTGLPGRPFSGDHLPVDQFSPSYTRPSADPLFTRALSVPPREVIAYCQGKHSVLIIPPFYLLVQWCRFPGAVGGALLGVPLIGGSLAVRA